MTDENWVPVKQLMSMFNYTSRDGVSSFAENHKVSKKKIKGTNYFNLDEFEQAKKEEDRKSSYRRVTHDTEADSKGLIVKWLNTEPLSIGELSRRLDRSKETIVRLLDEIHTAGIDVTYDDASKQAAISKKPHKFKEPLLLEPLYKHKIKIGCVSDTHLGSYFQQLSLLRTAYKVFDQEKCDFIVHAGDLCEGYGMHSDQSFECHTHGFDDILDYVVNNYPESKRGTLTYTIGGSHDMSYKKQAGANIVRAICEKRPDLIYRGEESASFSIVGKEWFNVNLLHPTSGLSYARSYKLQKQTEALVSSAFTTIRSYMLDPLATAKESVRVPMVLLVGHYHQAAYLPGYLGVDSFLLPCFESQTPYLKRKSLFPQIGFLLLSIEFDEKKNVTKVVPDFRFLDAYAKEKDY